MSKFLTPPVWYDKNGEENQSLVNAANAGVSGPTNIAFGLDAKSGTDNDSHSCIAIGYEATATGRNAIAIGSYDSDARPVGPDAGTRAAGSGTIAIGGGSSATAAGAVSFGESANAKNTGAIAIGHSAKTDGLGTGVIAIGYQSIASDNNAIAIGSGAQVKASGSIAIGAGATANETPNTIQLGNNNTAYTLNIGKNTIDPALVQEFFAGNMVGGVSGNLYVYSNVYKSGEAGSPRTGWYRAEIDSVKQTVVVRDGNGKIKAADPTAANDVATKQYVDNAIAALKL